MKHPTNTTTARNTAYQAALAAMPNPVELDPSNDEIRAEAVSHATDAALLSVFSTFDSEGHTADLGNLFDSPWSTPEAAATLDALRASLTAAFDLTRAAVDAAHERDADARALEYGIPSAAEALLAAASLPSACSADTFEAYANEVARKVGDSAPALRLVLQAVLDALPASE